MGIILTTEDITVSSNATLHVNKLTRDDKIEVSFLLRDVNDCRLHWGLSRSPGAKWKTPPHNCWPPGSIAFGEDAVQTPFKVAEGGKRITIRLNRSADFSIMNFVLYYPHTGSWDNNRGRNYQITLPEGGKPDTTAVDELREEMKDGTTLFETDYDIADEGRLSVTVLKSGDLFRVVFVSNIQGLLLLHWGVAVSSPFEWRVPPSTMLQSGSEVFHDKAAETAFMPYRNLNCLILEISEKEAPTGVPFVLHLRDDNEWLNNRGENFYVPVKELLQQERYQGPPELAETAREIIRSEMGRNSWSLMHRFNLCHDLLDRAGKDEEGLALLFVWMRYAFLRQLDWQRNYNTKPSELSHAQDRLTLKLAGIYVRQPHCRELIMLIMGTLGRGGEGQRIRDEILHIMHRHRIKEVAGHFMEEWHQKLHNNTTPDDIVICEAYLEFLRSEGDLALFYKTLEAGGVTRERLKSFERPIVTEPDFVPDLKGGLITDFENYLRLLRSVHSGTDLESAAHSAEHLLDHEMRGPLQNLMKYRSDHSVPVLTVAGSISELSGLLAKRVHAEKDMARVREMIYLALALEEYMRVVVERNIHVSTDRNHLVEIIGLVLEHQRCSYDNAELAECHRHWQRLKEMPRFDRDWSLHARAVLERLGRAIAGLSDRYYELLQDKASFLGKAFCAGQWMINMFSEEVVRGRLSFILSLLVHHLDPILRETAQLGVWQIISHGEAVGVVECVDDLRSIQGRSFDTPTIVIAERVRGDEEPVAGLRAVITPDLVDLVAHVSIRARNSRLLFATCYDKTVFAYMKSLKGQEVKLRVSPSGDVVTEKSEGEVSLELSAVKLEVKKISRPALRNYVVSSAEFSDTIVGGKSLNLVRLQGKLPDWIHVPASAAIPFGVCEEILDMEMNKTTAAHYYALLNRTGAHTEETLSEIRNTLLGLESPGKLVSALRIVAEESGLGWSGNWSDAWMCIKRVWASKWNERAYVSRSSRGIPHEDLFMAVLIQQVVRSEYAFVIHTVNPLTGDPNELYAELVRGLGETLVGNYPGRAMGFAAGKTGTAPGILAYPSKSTGLYGGGLIFRSDSNGEDLSEYAGAGLYDSIMLEPPGEVHLNYADEKLIWDEGFRNHIMTSIVNIGTTIEEIMGSPQDIEGAYSGGKFYVVQTRPQVGIVQGSGFKI